MSAAEVAADYKVTVSGGDRLTAEKLDGVLKVLHERGVPGWANVEVNRQPGRNASGWVVIARWDPTEEPAVKPVAGAESFPGLNPETVARRIQHSGYGQLR